MNITIFISLLFFLQFLYWIVGRSSAKNLQTNEEYFLAGKSVKLFPLMMTFLATQVGGGLILGAAEEAFQFGWPVLLYPLGASLGLIFLGSGIGRRLAKFQVSTVAQIFEVVYGSRLLRKIASILSVISLFMILVAQIIASSKFLIGLGFNSPLLFILFWAVVILYTAQGGLRACISTDIVQAAFFSFVFLAAFGFVLCFEPSISLISMPKLVSFSCVSSKLCGWLLMPLLFMVIEQDMGQRCFAGACAKTVSKASLFSGIATMVVCVVPVFFGCLASSMNLQVPSGGSVLMAVIAKTTNPYIAAVMGCAVLAAIISTATSLINAIGSNISGDFSLSFFREVKATRVAQGVTCVISLFAIFFAFYFDNILGLLIQSYELSVSCLFVPIFLALCRKKGNFLSALLAIFLGGIGFALFRIIPISLPKEIVSIVFSFFGYICGEMIVRFRALQAREVA